MTVKSELRIPDLWFDFYARLLPGTFFVALMRVCVFDKRTIPEGIEILVLLAVGYFVGLFFAPIASWVIGKIEANVGVNELATKDIERWLKEDRRLDEKQRKDPRVFVEKVQYALERESNQAVILDKMHGECTFFVQTALLSGVFSVVSGIQLLGLVLAALDEPRPIVLPNPVTDSWRPLVVIGALFFSGLSFFFAILMAKRRVTRAVRKFRTLIPSDH